MRSLRMRSLRMRSLRIFAFLQFRQNFHQMWRSPCTLAVLAFLIMQCCYSNHETCSARLCNMRELELQWRRLDRLMDDGLPVFTNGPRVVQLPLERVIADESIARVPSVTGNDTARKLVLANVPFVFKSARALNLKKRWTAQYLKRDLGEVQIMTQMYWNKQLRYYDPEKAAKSKDAFPEVRDMTRPGATRRSLRTIAEMFGLDSKPNRSMLYGAITGYPLTEYLDYHLMQDAFDSFQHHIKEHSSQDPDFRFGFDPTEYGMHFDWHSNFLAQIHGTKRVVLLNPLQEANLDWQRNEQHPEHRQVSSWPRSDSNHHLFKKAKSVQCILEPGDVLYIPPVWWHYLEAQPEMSDGHALWLSVNRMAEYLENEKGEDAYLCPSY